MGAGLSRVNLLEQHYCKHSIPDIAIAAKACHGLKEIKDYNLSWAKEFYPDEF